MALRWAPLLCCGTHATALGVRCLEKLSSVIEVSVNRFVENTRPSGVEEGGRLFGSVAIEAESWETWS